MSKKRKEKDDQFDIELELVFQVSALTLASLFSVTALAPVLSSEVKQKLNQVTGVDFDVAHKFWKNEIIKAGEAASDLLKGSQEQPAKSKLSHIDKCKSEPHKKIEIAGWVFTIPSPNCI